MSPIENSALRPLNADELTTILLCLRMFQENRMLQKNENDQKRFNKLVNDYEEDGAKVLKDEDIDALCETLNTKGGFLVDATNIINGFTIIPPLGIQLTKEDIAVLKKTLIIQ